MNKVDSITIDEYRIEIISSQEQMDSLRKFWEESQFHPAADYEFFSLIVQERYNIVSTCVLLLLQNNEPVALLAGRIEKTQIPIRFGYLKVLKIPVRQVVFIAGGFMGERTEANWKRFLCFVKDLLRIGRLDLAVFEQLKVGSSEHEALSQVFKGTQKGLSFGESMHWQFKIPKTWDAFMKTRSKKHRYWLKRLPKVLDREYGEEWKIKTYTQEHEVRDFIFQADLVAAKTYQRALGVGFRNNIETLRRIDLDASRGRLKGYVLSIKNEPKAFWYCFSYNGTIYSAATGYDPNFRTYELGTILLMKIFQDNCGTESDVIDFGEGDADYKRRFGSLFFNETTCYLLSRSVRGWYLYFLLKLMLSGTNIAKNVLGRFDSLRSLKTNWRRKMIQKEASDRPTA